MSSNIRGCFSPRVSLSTSIGVRELLPVCWSPHLAHQLQPSASRYPLCFALTLVLVRLLVTGQRIVRAFPGREKIEFPEFLVEADRLVEHPLLLVVVADLDETGERKVLAQRMAVEAVVGQEPPHVGMAGEDHAIEVVALALEPVGAGKHVDDRR